MWTFGKRIFAGFALSWALLLVVGAVSYSRINVLASTAVAVDHSHKVLEHLAAYMGALRDAETGQRGFVITGEENYLEPYNAAIVAVPRIQSELHELVADNPTQLARVADADRLASSKLAELKRTIERRRTAGLEETRKEITIGAGKALMDDFRVALSAMDHAERETLAQRAQDVAEASSSSRVTIIVGTIVALLAVVIIAVWLTGTLTTRIGTAVQHLQSSSAELQAAAAQQASGARESSTAMNEITTTINELLATSRQIAESAARVAQVAAETSTASKAGDTTAQRAHESVGSIRRQVDQIVTHMLDLGKKSQQIGSILEIINELSEQTNILAINATIEAAGAGEAGKRFSVVAEEIRKLADRVGGSTKEIRVLIEEIRAAVNTTVMATESGSKAVDLGARQFGEVTVSLQQINALIVTTAESAREIQLSTKQQSTAVEQVNLAVSNVAKATRENETSASETVLTATQISTQSRDLNRLVRSDAS
ncbi:MAG: methyl-accepting chemotaxis protein [Polyangia bacterium]